MTVSKISNQLIVVVLDNLMRVWHINNSKPVSVPLLGQNSVKISSEARTESACKDVIDRLVDEGVEIGQVHWLVDKSSRIYWRKKMAEELCKDNRWQVLSWEWLSSRLGVTSGDEQQLKNIIFPWLTTSDSEVERKRMQQALQDEHQSESEKLAAERERLKHANEILYAQNIALQQVDAENLVRFLPALFPRVFTQLGAADLAALCGRVEPLNIPNPFPEPSEETLRALQKRFRALPLEHQREIVGFIADLPHRKNLQPRPEMRELIAELEDY